MVSPLFSEITENPKKLLLHACCAPCAAPASERVLKEGYQPTLFYSNPNIYPEAEWRRRAEAVIKLAEAFALPFIIEPRDHDSWLNLVSGKESERERGKRCTICFRRAINATAERASSEGFPFFTTTLTLSPLKDAQTIFGLGKKDPRFIPWDFKKKDGVRRSVELCRTLDLYRQNYCGCEFSISC
jgi:epoxyqueuosine reductase